MSELLLYVAAGFLAQMIDGVLGMGYGVSATSLLLSFGVPAAVSSASVHTAEVASSSFSAVAHYRMGNVVWDVAKRLMIPGIIGAVIGAYILTSISGERIRPFIAIYLLVMGVSILLKAFRPPTAGPRKTPLEPLGFFGGMLDAIGGGGWGPIVVATMLARGGEPRKTIGSANFAEFFVTVAAAITFLLTIGLAGWKPIVGLAVGGVIAAPIAARIVHRVPTKPLMIAVGLLVMLLSLRTIILATTSAA